jgi:hypothetical protein
MTFVSVVGVGVRSHPLDVLADYFKRRLTEKGMNMANYYTLFSFLLKKEDVGEAVIKDVMDALEVYADLYYENPNDEEFAALPEYMQKVVKEQAENDVPPGVDYDMQDGDLWLHDNDGSSNIDMLGEVISAALSRYNINKVIGFEYCNYWDKPRTDAYGGGAVLITPQGMRSMHSYDAMTTLAKKYHAEQARRHRRLK